MLKYELKEIWCDQIKDLNSYKPENDKDFFITVEMRIGHARSDKSDFFQVQVCSSIGLERWYRNEMPLILRHVILVEKYNWQQIEKYIRKIISDCYHEDWLHMAYLLSKHFQWEYEVEAFQNIFRLK